MKIFKYEFSKPTKIFIYIGLLLVATAFTANLVFVIKEDWTDVNLTYSIIKYALIGFNTVLLFVILITLLLSSYYAVDGTTLKTAFGIIKSKFDLEKVQTILLDRNTDKLSVHFEDGNFIVIAVKGCHYTDFIEAVMAANPKIDYSVNSKEGDKPEKEN